MRSRRYRGAAFESLTVAYLYNLNDELLSVTVSGIPVAASGLPILGLDYVGFVVSAYRAEDPVHEQVVAALQTQYDDLFLGCVADRQQGEVVFERMAAQLTQRRAERALSLAA